MPYFIGAVKYGDMGGTGALWYAQVHEKIWIVELKSNFANWYQLAPVAGIMYLVSNPT